MILPHGSTATPEGLQGFVRERLAPHKIPREVILVSELPRTGSGKIDRSALRRLTPPGDTEGRQA